METISKPAALSILSKWERQDRTLSALCFGAVFSLSSQTVKVAMCLDDGLELAIAKTTKVRLFLREAEFSRFGPDNFHAEPANLVGEF